MSIPTSPRAVVTGAASGLGRALCVALAKRSARVVVSDIDVAGAEQTAHEVEAAGGKARVQRCDVSKLEQLEALASFAESEFGGTDLIVNNAGVGVAGAVGSVSLGDWEWVMGINLWGVIYGCHVFAPRLKQQGKGHILNIASAAGLMSAPNMAPYNVTKAGVVSLSETLRTELTESGVGVTVVCPTFFQTNIVNSGRFGGQDAMTNSAKDLMQKSKVQAGDVATRALKSCDRDQLYCVPMSDAQWGWRVKRLAPESFYKTLLPAAIKDALGGAK